VLVVGHLTRLLVPRADTMMLCRQQTSFFARCAGFNGRGIAATMFLGPLDVLGC
jgi:hypothetical protein